MKTKYLREATAMCSMNNRRRSVLVLISMILCFTFPLAAQTMDPPYFGPPGTHANTLSGLVDDDGVPGPSAGDSVAYFAWADRGQTQNTIDTINPWEDCAQNPEAFVLTAYMTGDQQGIFVDFENAAFFRGFNFNNFDNSGNPIGGDYWSEFGDYGTATLEKTNAGQSQYDLVHLESVVPGRQLDIVLPLVTHLGDGVDYVGVGNIASLGVIGPCGNADANTAIMIPLGDHNGEPAIILDLEGDGSPTVGFLPSAPVGVRQQPPEPAIPALNTWGIAILTISLLAIGLMIIRWSGGAISI